MPARKSFRVSKAQAKRIWLRAQKLDAAAPFGDGADATRAAIEHLGYVQIDTINVIERCHHHILFSRIPAYRREHLRQAQSVDKSVFEYWTHALSYIPTRDIRFFLGDMKEHQAAPGNSFAAVKPDELRKLLRRIRRDGPVSIRDIEDEVLIEKEHLWASRKPSKRVLQHGFYGGLLTVSHRAGMLKTYELMDRHFGWERRPRPSSSRDRNNYLLDRALRAQGIVSLDSICHLNAPRKADILRLIDGRLRRKNLLRVDIEGAGKTAHWAEPLSLEGAPDPIEAPVHILSPFDPLIIQRKRLKLFFDYDHLFEAYVPKEKRRLGYFALPVLIDDRIVAALDVKADREKRKLLMQKWTWIDGASRKTAKARIEEALHRFEQFQFDG